MEKKYRKHVKNSKIDQVVDDDEKKLYLKNSKKQKLRERLVEECEEIFQTPTFSDKKKSIHQRLLEAETEKPEYYLKEIFQTPTFRDKKKSIRQRLIEAGI